jgi:hypothetical protein
VISALGKKKVCLGEPKLPTIFPEVQELDGNMTDNIDSGVGPIRWGCSRQKL